MKVLFTSDIQKISESPYQVELAFTEYGYQISQIDPEVDEGTPVAICGNLQDAIIYMEAEMKIEMPKLTETQATIIEQAGAESWPEIIDWFGGMTEEQILADCNQCWPWDDNAEFAALIYSELN